MAKKLEKITVQNNTTGELMTYAPSKGAKGIDWVYHHDGRLLVIFEVTGEGKDDWRPLAHLSNHSMVLLNFKEVKNEKV